MSKFHKECECNHNYNNVVSGNSLDLDINHCESEIRADVVVSEYNSVRLWGRIVNCEGNPIPNALVKLIKVECEGQRVYYKGIAHTISDCEGFYQFELCNPYDNHGKEISYKVIVSKAAYGAERVIPNCALKCDPCDPCDKTPCDSCGIEKHDCCKEYPPMPCYGKEHGPYFDDNDCMCGSGTYYPKQKPRY